VLHIGLDIWFTRPEWQAGIPGYSYPVSYGTNHFLLRPDQEYQTNKLPIAPGATVDVVLSQEDHNRINSALRELDYPPSLGASTYASGP
jgi:hypothetical protein